MKTPRSFSQTRFVSPVRFAIVGSIITAAAAMAFVAAKSSSPSPVAKSSSPSLAAKLGSKRAAELEEKFARNKAFAEHFKTLLGRAKSSGEGSRLDGPAQEAYDNRAYPAKWIGAAQRRAAWAAANALRNAGRPSSSPLSSPLTPLLVPLPPPPAYPNTAWDRLGPNGVPASATVAGESTASSVGTTYSGRATAIAVDPNCTYPNCTIFIGAAGGGVWKTTDTGLTWAQVSDGGIPSNAIGSIVFDPTNSSTIYVGTGEPNGSGDSEAGVGLYRSTDGGLTWAVVPGTDPNDATKNTQPCADGSGDHCPVADGRSIGAIAIDPAAPTHIFIGTDVARHGSSSVNGGRFTPPGSAKVGLYESTDNGVHFSPAVILTQDTVSPGSATGGDYYRGGCSHIEFYAAGGPDVYASFFDYGVYRRRTGDTGPDINGFHQVFKSAGGGSAGQSILSRTEFSLAPNGSDLRIYVGDAAGTKAFPSGLGQLYRVDNANVPNTQLLNNAGSNAGWTSLSCPTKGQPCYSSYNYCGGQCTYDMPVYSPPGFPDIVYIGGAMQYDEIFTARRPSNGRAVQRSEDAGATFTDMTQDDSHRTTQSTGLSRHPDQHAMAAVPGNPDILFNGDDGGIWRLNGSFTDASGVCSLRGLTGTDLTDCQMWLKQIPTTITSLNGGLETLQYQSLSYDPSDPTGTLLGGTQDNGTHLRSGGDWSVNVFGDGGQSGISAFNSDIRFHNYYLASPDVNFQGDSEFAWDWIGDPLFDVEPQSFYIPMIFDPTNEGYMYAGLDFVWRTTDNGGNQATLDLHCNELTGDFPPQVTCGDWVRLGAQGGTGKALGDGRYWGADKSAGGYVVATERATKDNRTLWVGTRRGRVFVTQNANAANPTTVAFYRIDSFPGAANIATPSRFVSGIDIDPGNENHAFLSYSGYNAYATAAGTATGHLFEATYNPGTHQATWTEVDTTALGDQPITDVAVDWPNNDIYVSTDFGVWVRHAGTWSEAGTSLPPVAVYGLTINVDSRVLYAATHGRSAWRLTLP